MAILPTVVTDERLVWANGRLFAGELTANQFIGPSLGALLFVTSQAAPPFVDALTFAASALLLLGVRQRVPAQPPTPTSRRRLRQDVMEGLAFVWHNRDIRLLALGAAVINIAESATLAVLVLWVTGPIGLGAGGFGMVLTLGAIGGVVGSVLADRVVTRTGNRRSILAAVWCLSLGLGTTGILAHPALTVIGIAVTGASAQLWNVVAVSYRQRQTPPALRGRVMSAYRVIAYGTYPVGAMFGGLVASVASVRTTFAVSAVIVGSLALGMQRWFGQVEVV
jgi:Na+/melibiose symporter-like transporter